MTKGELKVLRREEAERLGKKFPIFSDYDRGEYVRNAIFEHNHHPHCKHILSDDVIERIMERVIVRGFFEGEGRLDVLNNPTSRKRGLYSVLGKELFRLINEDGNLRGVLTPFVRDVRTDFRVRKKKAVV